MNSAIWVFERGHVCLRLASGETVEPTALEIFKAAFGHATDWRGVTIGNPLDDIQGITFSREPAQPALRIYEHGNALKADLGVETDAGFTAVGEARDQVVVGMRWYPVHLPALIDAANWLRSLGLELGESLTVGTLVALRMRSDVPFKVLDEVTFTANSRDVEVAEVLEIPGFVGTLYPYQNEGVSFLRLISNQGVGCILGDEMGLGKTAQVIALFQSEKNLGRAQSLIVAPATLLENWRREIAQFAPNLTVLLHSGSTRAGVASKLIGTDLVLVSYETAIRDEQLLSTIAWNVVALDEAQSIKNPDALRTAAVKRLPRRVSIAVTGTPLENRLDDLWSIADFALPGFSLSGSTLPVFHRLSDGS